MSLAFALIEAIFSDAETPEQGITITTTNTPLMVQLHPDGNVQITVSSEALADEVVVATDDARILEAVTAAGFPCEMTADHPTGTDRIGVTSPGSTRPSDFLWQRLYLRPEPQ